MIVMESMSLLCESECHDASGFFDVSVLQEKCSHLTWTIKQLNKQLKSKAIRSEGIDLLGKSLERTRKENQQLKEKTQKYHKILVSLISNYQKQQNITLNNNEKELLLSLVGVQNTEAMEQFTNNTCEEIRRLKEELITTKEKLIEAENIIKLKSSQPTVDFRMNINPEVECLQEYQLLKRETNDFLFIGDKIRHSCDSQGKTLQQDHNEGIINNLKHEVISLKDENQKLKNCYDEVLAMNKRWQKYNCDRDEYVHSLLSTIYTLQNSDPHCFVHKNFQNSHSKIRKENRKEIANVKQCFCCTMCATVLPKTERNVCLQAERCCRILGFSRKDDLEKIQVLEHQVKLFTEDWQAERADRESAKSRIIDLENENKLLVEQLKEYESHERRHYCTTYSYNLLGQSDERLIPRSFQNRPTNIYIGNFEVDGIPEKNDITIEEIKDDEATSDGTKETKTVLPCPQCGKNFEQKELLDHFESCQ